MVAKYSDEDKKLLTRLQREESQFDAERDRHKSERARLDQEVKRLQDQVKVTKDKKKRDELQYEISLLKAKRDLAHSKWGKANALGWQRWHEQFKVRGEVGAEDLIQHYKKEAEECEDKVKKNEEAVAKLEKKREQYEEKKSKQLLDGAMKKGFAEVIIAVCIVLGQPGVGKTHMKYLLLDRRPPHLRTSTGLAETPIRIEIRSVSGSRIQNIRGQWKDVSEKEMLDILARMILIAEPQLSEKTEGGLFSRIAAKLFQTESSDTAGAKLPPSLDEVPRAKKKAADPDAGPSLSGTCREAMKEIVDQLVERISKLRGEGELGEASGDSLSDLVLTSKWIYFTDSGGQPEYHELLPLFVHSISSALCVTRLTDKLDEVQDVEYYRDGKQVGSSQQAQLSAKDTIQCLFNTVQSYSDQEKPPKVMMIGTHRDKLEEAIAQASNDPSLPQPETLEEKNAKLLDMLLPEHGEQLVYSSNDMKELIFPLNARDPDDTDKAIAEKIRRHIEALGARKVKIPIWWHILEMLLQELAKKLDRGVLSKAECLEMAGLIGIREDALVAALQFFDELNVIKYTPDVLPSAVFMDSQIPLTKLSELVCHHYRLCGPETGEGSLLVDDECRHFRDRGIVSKEFLKRFQRHYVPDIFSIDDLCELLKKYLVFAPVTNPSTSKAADSAPIEGRGETHFVMPSLQQVLSDAELGSYRDGSLGLAALLVRFPRGSRRAGVFCCFVVHLIRHCGWKLLLDETKKLYRNCLQLRLPTSPPCVVTLIDSNTYIEVHVKITDDTPARECADLLNVIKNAIVTGIGGACSALKYKQTVPEFTFYCPHLSSSSCEPQPKELGQHTASLNDKKTHLCCDVVRDKSYRLLPEHLLWFGISQGSSQFSPSGRSLSGEESQTGLSSTPDSSNQEGAAQTIPQSSDSVGSQSAVNTTSSLSSGAASTVYTSHHLAGVESATTHNVSSVESETQCSEYASPSTSQSSSTVATSQAQRMEQSSRPSGAFPQPTSDTASHSPHHVHEEASTSPTFTVPTSASCTASNVVDTGGPIRSTKSSPLAKPTSRNLTLIEWRNEQSQMQEFRLKQLICHKWKDIGSLLDIPLPLLIGWEKKYREDPIDSITAVLGHWFENHSKIYPLTWEGLDHLLNNAQLGQVAEDLKQALANACD